MDAQSAGQAGTFGGFACASFIASIFAKIGEFVIILCIDALNIFLTIV
jgi:hypothetical protein